MGQEPGWTSGIRDVVGEKAMIPMSIKFLGDDERAWIDVSEVHDGKMELAVSPHGLSSGKPSVLVRIDVDGKIYVIPTTARLFCTMGKMIEAKYPDLFDDGEVR